MESPERCLSGENGAVREAAEWGRRATLHVGTFNHKPLDRPTKRRRFSEDLLQKNPVRARPISGLAARCRAWTMRFQRNSTIAKDEEPFGRWKTSPCASSLAINMSLLVGTADVLSDIAERAFFTALQNDDVDEVSLAIDRYEDTLPFGCGTKGTVDHPNRRESLQTEILLRNCEQLLGRYEEGGLDSAVPDSPKSSQTTDAIYRNALHTAVYYESTNVVELLLSRGFDPNAIGEIHSIPESAIARESVFRFMYPQSLSGQDMKSSMVEDFWITKPVLFLAAHVGNLVILKKLLSYGASVHTTDGNGNIPLHFAVSNLAQNIRCVSVLIESGSSLQHCNIDRRTSLDVCPELRNLYKRIVLDHLEPLSPDSVTVTSDEVIHKRRLRSIGAVTPRKQSIGSLTLSKLKLKKGTPKGESKSTHHKDEAESDRPQEQKRLSVGRRMSFAFRNFFEKRKKSHSDDTNDTEQSDSGQNGGPKSLQGGASRLVARRRCVSFNDKVEKYPYDFEQSIATLSLMASDHDCALMIARRLPRCWPRILTLATTLGSDVCRNTTTVLSAVKNMIVNREHHEKRKSKTLEQPVAVLKLAMGILSSCGSADKRTLREIVCKMIGYVTEELAFRCSSSRNRRARRDVVIPINHDILTTRGRTYLIGNNCLETGSTTTRSPLDDSIRRYPSVSTQGINNLEVFGKIEGRNKPFCNKCGISLHDIHYLRDYNVRNFRKGKCRLKLISLRKFIGSCRSVLGHDLLLGCLSELRSTRHQRRSIPPSNRTSIPPSNRTIPRLSLNSSSNIPDEIECFIDEVEEVESRHSKSFKQNNVSASGHGRGTTLRSYGTHLPNENDGVEPEVPKARNRMTILMKAIFSDRRFVTSSAVNVCLEKLSLTPSGGEEIDWYFCLSVVHILQVAFLHPPSSDLESLDLRGAILPILQRDSLTDGHSRKDGTSALFLLEAFRLLVFSGNLVDAVDLAQYPFLQSRLSRPQDRSTGGLADRLLIPLCQFLLFLVNIDKGSVPSFDDWSEGRSEWTMFFEIVPFMVHTCVLLNGVQVYLRIYRKMNNAKADAPTVYGEGITNALHFLAEWLKRYPQDFLRDSAADRASQALLALLHEMSLSRHPTTIQLKSTTSRVKRGDSARDIGLRRRQKSFANRRPVNRSSSTPLQPTPGWFPDRSLDGSDRSLDRLSASTPTRITRTLGKLLSLRPASPQTQSLADRFTLDRKYYLWQGRVTAGEIQCDSDVVAKLASIQMQIEASSESSSLTNCPTRDCLQETDLLSPAPTGDPQPDPKGHARFFFHRWTIRGKTRNSEPNILSTSSQESLSSARSGGSAAPLHGSRSIHRGRLRFASFRWKRDRFHNSSRKSKSEDLPGNNNWDHCLPQEQRDNPRVHRLIQLHMKGREWVPRGVDEGRVGALKVKYISICEGLQLDQMVTYPVRLLGRTNKKKTHLLHISETHISLLQAETKSPVERHPLPSVEDWHVAFERDAGGYPTLVVTFADNDSWRLLVATPQQVKHICTALSAAMEETQCSNNNNEAGPILSPPPATTLVTSSPATTVPAAADPAAKETVIRAKQKKDKLKELLGQTPIASLSPEDRDLAHCRHHLRFPVEAASILTDTEYPLFQEVKSSSYVNYIRNNGLRLAETGTGEGVAKTIHDLKDRCEKVTEWVVSSVTDVAEEAQFPLLMQFVDLANTCWNMGNFQAVVEILEAVLSEGLEEILQHADSDDVSALMALHQCILEGEPDYQFALDKSLRIPGSRVVPYFGVFLDQLVAVFEEPSPAVALSMLEMEREICEFDWWMKDGDMPTTSPGLLSTAKMSQAYWIMEDLRFCQRMARQNATLEDFAETDSPMVVSGTYENEDLAYHSCSEDFDDAESIEPLPKTHGLEIVPQQCVDANLNALHCMQRGTRVYRVDDEGSKFAECFLRLDESNAVLIWTKLQQKDLPVGSLTASLSILSSKYSTTNYIVGGLEEGFLDLTHAKELLPESEEVDCAHISQTTDYELRPFAVMYGSSLVENKRLCFLAPRATCAIWKAGLEPIIRVVQTQQRLLSDKRSKWLMKHFLNAFFFKGNLGGPTALEAIQIFGGKNATFSKVKDQANDNEGPTVFQPAAKLALRKKKEEKAQRKESAIQAAAIQKAATEAAAGLAQVSAPRPKKKKKIGLGKLRKKGKKKEGSSPLAEAGATPEDPDQESESDEDESDNDSEAGSDDLEKDEYQMYSSGFEGSDFTGEGEPSKKEGETKEKAAKAMSFYSKLTFPEFAQLFQAFSIRTRKDLKDIFEGASYKLPNIPSGDTSATTTSSEKPGVPHVTRNILTNTVHPEVSKVLDILATSSITSNSAGPPQTMNIQVMGAEELQSFLLEIQGDNCTIPEVNTLIRRHEPNRDLRSNELLSFEGFVRLLMDKENYAFNHEEMANEPLSEPLSHYYCKSSHNTYLTGHQLRGESSVELYAQVLLTGCRCVELDCWDGDDGWPIIYHGHTLTTKISFKDVVEAINKSAFVTTPYPVILSIENHCSMAQQTRMAAIFQEVLGDKLVKNFMFESDSTEDAYLPSPESLKWKIIVKNKKIKTKEDKEAKLKASKTDSGLQNGELSDEDDDDYLFEDAYEDLSSAEDNTSLSVESKKFSAQESLEDQASEKSAIGKQKHKRNASGNQNLVAIAAAAEEAQKKKKKKEPIIAPELSELINYCQSVKFPGFDDPEDDESKKKKGKKLLELEEEGDDEDGGKISKGKKGKKGEGDEDSDSKSKKKKKDKKKADLETSEVVGDAAAEEDSDSKSRKKLEEKKRKKEEKERKKLEKKLKKLGKEVKDPEKGLETVGPLEKNLGDVVPRDSSEENGVAGETVANAAGDGLANGNVREEERKDEVEKEEESESEEEEEQEEEKEGDDGSTGPEDPQFVRGISGEDSDEKEKKGVGIRLSFRKKDKEKEEKKKKKKEAKEKKKKDKKKKSGKDDPEELEGQEEEEEAAEDLEVVQENGNQEEEQEVENSQNEATVVTSAGDEVGHEKVLVERGVVVNGVNGHSDGGEEPKHEEILGEGSGDAGVEGSGQEVGGDGDTAKENKDAGDQKGIVAPGEEGSGESSTEVTIIDSNANAQKTLENGDVSKTVEEVLKTDKEVLTTGEDVLKTDEDVSKTAESSETNTGDGTRTLDSSLIHQEENGVASFEKENGGLPNLSKNGLEVPETSSKDELLPELKEDAGMEFPAKGSDTAGVDEAADTEDDITTSINTNGIRDEDLERIEEIKEDTRVEEVGLSKGDQDGSPPEDGSEVGGVKEGEEVTEGETLSGVAMTKQERREAKRQEKAARKVEKEARKAGIQREENQSKRWKQAATTISRSASVIDDSDDSDEFQSRERVRPLKSRTKSCHISSLNESHLKKMFRKFGSKFVQHCEFQLIRTYPAGMRIDSSNYNPLLYWACGIQLVALNYQKEDLPMHLQMAFFEQNGSCGYVLKPDFMRSRAHPLFSRFNAFGKLVPGYKVKELTIEVVSGQYLNPHNPSASSYVELELIGIPCDCSKVKTKPVSKNTTNPIWNEEFSFRVAFEDLAFIRFAVVDNGSGNVIAQRIIPVKCLRKGYRHVRLRSSQNVPLELSTLFILNRLTEVQDDEIENAIQKKEQLTDLVYYYIGKELADNVSQGVAEASSVPVYGIDASDVDTLLWTTGDTKVGELLAEAVGRAGKPVEDLENYVLEEEAVLNFRQGDEDVQREERVLGSEENVHEVQAAWNGKGRFLLKLAENASPAATVPGQLFLVSVYTRGVSVEMDTMSFEISVNATTPDVIARVLAKAGRLDVDPEQYSLYEEKSKDGKNLNVDTGRKGSDKIVQRLIGDDEKPWDVQSQWITSGTNGRFSVRDKNEEKSTSSSKLRRVTSLRQRKQKIMQSAAVQAKKVSLTGEIPEGIKPESKNRKVSKLKIWKSS